MVTQLQMYPIICDCFRNADAVEKFGVVLSCRWIQIQNKNNFIEKAMREAFKFLELIEKEAGTETGCLSIVTASKMYNVAIAVTPIFPHWSAKKMKLPQMSL